MAKPTPIRIIHHHTPIGKSCITWRKSGPPGPVMRCNAKQRTVMPDVDAKKCELYRDARNTSEVIPAGKVVP